MNILAQKSLKKLHKLSGFLLVNRGFYYPFRTDKLTQ